MHSKPRRRWAGRGSLSGLSGALRQDTGWPGWPRLRAGSRRRRGDEGPVALADRQLPGERPGRPRGRLRLGLRAAGRWRSLVLLAARSEGGWRGPRRVADYGREPGEDRAILSAQYADP